MSALNVDKLKYIEETDDSTVSLPGVVDHGLRKGDLAASCLAGFATYACIDGLIDKDWLLSIISAALVWGAVGWRSITQQALESLRTNPVQNSNANLP